MAWRVVRYQEVSINDTRGRKTTSPTGLVVPSLYPWFYAVPSGGLGGGGGVGVITPPPCSWKCCVFIIFRRQGRSPTINTPPCGHHPPPPFRKSCIRACVPYRNVPRLWEIRGPYDTLFYYVVNVWINSVSIIYESLEGTSNFLLLTSN